jgi:hypothetical protein
MVGTLAIRLLSGCSVPAVAVARSLEATELITKLLSTPNRGPRETELKREVDPVITRGDAEPK